MPLNGPRFLSAAWSRAGTPWLSPTQLRQEKIGLENVLEAESESHVNRLSRELSALRIAQQQLQAQHQNGAASSANNGAPGSVGSTGMFSISPETRIGVQHLASRSNPLEPSPEVMLEAMRRENEQLRNRLTDTEREFVRISRLNDIYREELIEHRTKVSLIFFFSNKPGIGSRASRCTSLWKT